MNDPVAEATELLTKDLLARANESWKVRQRWVDVATAAAAWLNAADEADRVGVPSLLRPVALQVD